MNKYKTFYLYIALFYVSTLVFISGIFQSCASTKEACLLQHDSTNQKIPTNLCTGFINKTLDTGKVMKRYVVYVPYEYTPNSKFPMIVFLHGAGERSYNGLLPTEVGLGTAIRRHPERWKAIVVFPQCPPTRFYYEMVEDLDACIEKTMREYSIDRSRIYLTGLSMGGFGTWIYGAMRSNLFSALVPICGGGELAFIKQRLNLQNIPDESPEEVQERIRKLVNMPIWAFHGAEDDVVPVECSRDFVQKLKEAGNTKVLYTEYPGVKHNSWVKAYDDPELPKWLFSQHK